MDNIIYNNRTYFINKEDSLSDLLKHEELLQLPISKWVDLLILKDGDYSINTLNTILIEIIKLYGLSLKKFTYKEHSYWIDKNTRTSLHELLKISKDSFSLIIGTNIVNMPVEKAQLFLNNLELYASKCKVNTIKHINNVKGLNSLEDILNYSYIEGYPDKLILNE